MRHLLLIILFLAATPAQAQELLHFWNFNNEESSAPAFPSPHPADVTIGGGELTYSFDPAFVTSFGGTTLNAVDGSITGGSLSIQGGAGESNNGEHFDLHIPSTGYTQLSLSYATRGTNSGFDTHTISYSLDGADFVELESTDGNRSTSWRLTEIDLAAVEGAANNSDLVVRITVDGATSNTGNNRFDNIAVYGYAAGDNRPPVFATELTDRPINASELFEFAYDAEDPDGDAVMYALEEGPEGAAIDESTGVFTWTPTVDQGDRDHLVRVSASDGSLSTTTEATLHVLAYPDNTAPVFTAALTDTLISVGDELVYTYVAADDDADELTLELLAAPDGVTFDAASGAISWTVTSPGAYRIVVSATDGMATTLADAVVGVRGLILGDLEGEALRAQLRELYAPTQVLGYDIARDSMYGVLDVGPDNFVRGVYTGYGVEMTDPATPRSVMAAGGIDAEHTWPQSKGAGTGTARSDLHHLFPSKSNVNSARGNKPFGELTADQTITWYRDGEQVSDTPGDDLGTYSRSGASRFQPRDAHAGAAARAILYFFTTYEEQADVLFLAEQAETVVRWSRDFTPSASEVRRTYRISEWQGNVNPFVFDSTLAERIVVDVEVPEPIPMGEARELEDGAQVVVEGIVTRARGRYLRFQDETGGLTIFDSYGSINSAIARGDIADGDVLRVTGAMESFSGMRQIGSISTFEVVSRANELPEPAMLTAEDLAENAAEYESRLVQVDDFLIVAEEGETFAESTTYSLTDAEGNPLALDLRIQREGDSQLVGRPIPEGPLTYIGILGRHYENFQIEGITAADLQPYVDTSVPAGRLTKFTVSAPYPNPAQALARFDLTTAAAGDLRAELYDALGRRVAVIVDAPVAAGAQQTMEVDLSDLPSGLYFLRVESGGRVEQRSILNVR